MRSAEEPPKWTLTKNGVSHAPDDNAVSEAISESIKVEKETRELFERGLIDQEEVDHRIGNATQVVLFAEYAAARLENVAAIRPNDTGQ